MEISQDHVFVQYNDPEYIEQFYRNYLQDDK